MITFIPAWSDATTNEISSDDLIGQIKSFMKDDGSYQILISNYMPSLRYFLHRYELLESNYWNLFDDLQNATDFEQQRLELTDLNLGDNISYYYSPFSISIFSNNSEVARVRVADGGVIKQVVHLVNGERTLMDTYDDRGFLSSQSNLSENTVTYFDIDGNWILKAANDQSIAVNHDILKQLQKDNYANINDLIAEVLTNKMQEIAENDAIVMSVTDQNLSYISNHELSSQITASFFNKRVNITSENQALLEQTLNKVNAVIVDVDQMMSSIKQLVPNSDNLYKISPYDTRFDFGASQSLKEEIIFVDVRHNNEADKVAIITEIIKMIDEEQISSLDNERDLRVLIRTNPADKDGLSNIVADIINNYFAEESELVTSTIQDKGENNLDLDMMTEFTPRVLKVMSLTNNIKVESLQTDEELYQVLNTARIVIDLADNPDLFTQIAAISTGIPQLNHVATEYVQNDKNGRIIENISDLSAGLKLYLNQLKYWQEAQAFSAEQIKKYSGNSLKEYLLKIVGEKSDGQKD